MLDLLFCPKLRLDINKAAITKQRRISLNIGIEIRNYIPEMPEILFAIS
jgi:hypothetical protein